MTVAVSLACAGLAVVAAVASWGRAARAERRATSAEDAVLRVAALLAEGEELWADRYDLALMQDDVASELACMRTQASIAHARARLEDRHGSRQG